VLGRLAERYGVNLINFDGESSEIGCRDAVRRAIEAGRPLRILYLSDFDPGGRSMPVAAARKLEYWLRTNHPDLEVTVDPIALLPEQVRHYGLPSIPMKDGERRADKFRKDFGADATELDALEALHPGELRKIVERAIWRHYDSTLHTRVREARRPIEEAIADAEAEVAEQFAEQVEALQADLSATAAQVRELRSRISEVWEEYRQALRDAAPSLAGVGIPRARNESDHLTPLFDSRRDYLTQLDFYRAWQRRAMSGGTP
jgi:hypothetical protein